MHHKQLQFFSHSATAQCIYHSCGLLQVQEEADVTAGGVMLPLTAKEKPIAGTVVRTGPGKLQEEGTRSSPKASSICLFAALTEVLHLL